MAPKPDEKIVIPEIMMAVPETNALAQMVLHFLRTISNQLEDVKKEQDSIAKKVNILYAERNQRKGAMALVEFVLKYGLIILSGIAAGVWFIIKGFKS